MLTDSMASFMEEVEEGLTDLEARPLVLIHVRGLGSESKARWLESGTNGGVEASRGAGSRSCSKGLLGP